MKKLLFLLIIPLLSFGQCISGDCVDGQGTYTWANGYKYVGEWKDGKQHGQGTCTFASGASFDGEWKDGKKYKGLYKYKSGDSFDGEWKDGKKYKGLYKHKKENITYEETYENFEVITFSVVEIPPIFPGCENLKIDEVTKEISHQIDILNSIYEELKSLNYFLKKNKNKREVIRLSQYLDLPLKKKQIKFIEKVNERYINKINLLLENSCCIEFQIVSHIRKKLNWNTQLKIKDDKIGVFYVGSELLYPKLLDYISSKIKEFESDLIGAKISVEKYEISLKSAAQKHCFNKLLKKHINKNFEYPKMAKQMGVQEKIFVKFVIDKTGEITNVQVVRGEDPYLKAEAIRLVESLPKMTPPNHGGEPISIPYTFPINFMLRKPTN